VNINKCPPIFTFLPSLAVEISEIDTVTSKEQNAKSKMQRSLSYLMGVLVVCSTCRSPYPSEDPNIRNKYIVLKMSLIISV